jgi:hypothetical protein
MKWTQGSLWSVPEPSERRARAIERYVQTPESSVGHSQVIETPGFAVRIFRRYGDCQSSLLKMDALMRLPGCEVALAKAAQGSCFTLGSRISL